MTVAASPSGSDRRLGPALVFLVLAVHATALASGFVDFDDPEIFLQNPLLQSREPSVLLDIFSLGRENWRPVRDASHWLDFVLHGQTAWLAHLHNLALLGVVVSLFWRIFERLDRGGLPGFVALLLAFVHPVQVEAIAWVSGRKELLAAVFFLWFCLAFVGFVQGEGRSGWRALGLGLLLVLGVGAKGHVIVLPAVALCLAVHEQFRGANRRSFKVLAGMLAALVLVALALVPLVDRGSVVHQPVANGLDQPTLVLQDKLQIPLRYLGKVFWPVDLNHIVLTEPLGPAHTAFAALSAAFALGWLGLAARRLWRRDPRGAWLLIPAVLLAPYLHLKPGVVYIADRYLFLVLPFAVSLVVEVAARVLPSRTARGSLAVGVALLLAVQSLTVHLAWRDSVHLWGRMIEVYPTSAWGYDRLGRALIEAGSIEEAAGAFLAAAERAPRESRHQNNAAVAFLRAGRVELAVLHFEKALALDPNNPQALKNLRELTGRGP
ncbi:MAG: tetratricopeptide repeat protein [Bradymonadia bacterium]|jgi:hypothetical protein